MHHPRHDRAIAVASVRHERAALRRHNRDVTASPHSAASTWRRGVATLLPAVMPLAMKAVFRATTRRYGPERGYQAGFAIYWASCWAMAGTVVGPRRLLGLWQVPEQVLPAPRGLSAAVLVAPPLGGLATQWVPNTFPDDPLRGWLWPAVGFTAWHLVPLTTRPSSLRRRAALLAGAASVGLGYGWIALRTRSLALVAPAHALIDSSRVVPVRANWLTGRP
jgi:hypothetical protein